MAGTTPSSSPRGGGHGESTGREQGKLREQDEADFTRTKPLSHFYHGIASVSLNWIRGKKDIGGLCTWLGITKKQQDSSEQTPFAPISQLTTGPGAPLAAHGLHNDIGIFAGMLPKRLVQGIQVGVRHLRCQLASLRGSRHAAGSNRGSRCESSDPCRCGTNPACQRHLCRGGGRCRRRSRSPESCRVIFTGFGAALQEWQSRSVLGPEAGSRYAPVRYRLCSKFPQSRVMPEGRGEGCPAVTSHLPAVTLRLPWGCEEFANWFAAGDRAPLLGRVLPSPGICRGFGICAEAIGRLRRSQSSGRNCSCANNFMRRAASSATGGPWLHARYRKLLP